MSGLKRMTIFRAFQGRLYKKNLVDSVTDMLKVIPVKDFQRRYQIGNNVFISV
jgi:hypothetical protein